MVSYTVRTQNGKLAGPFGLRVIRAFVVSGKFNEHDLLVTADGEMPLSQHPELQELWQAPTTTSAMPTGNAPASNAPASHPTSTSPATETVQGRVVLHQGKVLPPGANPNFAGALSTHPLSFLMYRFMLSKMTGRLHLRSGRETVDIFLEQGIPTYAASNKLETRLGERLVFDGTLDRSHQARLLQRAEKERRPLGQLLLEENRLTPTQVQEALTSQFESRFFMALSWKESAVYRFYTGQITGGQFPIQVDRWILLKEGAFRWLPLARIEDMLLPYRNSLVIRQIHPKLSLTDFVFSRNENAFIERITQNDPVNDVIGDAVERRLLEEEHATRLLYLLWQLQFLRMGEEKVGARTQRQIEELTLYINRLKGQNRLGRLGLQGGASPAEIRKSYIELAKRYHPDHLQPGTHSLVAERTSEAFALIADAYRILSG